MQGQGASFTPENPCDSVLHTIPFMWMLELKSTKGSSISFFPSTPWEKPKGTNSQKMIKPNQVKSLMETVEQQGIISGFILNFRPRELKTGATENRVFFIHIKDFVEFAEGSNKASINIEDCEQLGVEIYGKLLRVHYRYDIEDFIDRAIVYYLHKGYIANEMLSRLREWIENIQGAIAGGVDSDS